MTKKGGLCCKRALLGDLGPLGLVFGALGRVGAALLVILMPLGGSLDFQGFLQTFIRAI